MTPAARERLRVRIPLFAASGAAWLLLAANPHASCASPAGGSALMFSTMMLPLIGPPVLHVRDSSFARRRLRSIVLFVAGYASLWLAAGVALLLLSMSIAGSPPLVAAAAIAIGVWQCSPAKQRCLNRCHAESRLSPFGVAADRDALRFGWTHGFWCIGSCFGLMLLPMLLPHGQIVAMAGMTLWLAGERLEAPSAATWQLRGPAKAARIAIDLVRRAK